MIWMPVFKPAFLFSKAVGEAGYHTYGPVPIFMPPDPLRA